MIPCFCDRLYKTDTLSVKSEYVFGGSLCRIREFKTETRTRFCITIFSLSDYKHLHFPHEEYKWLIKKLYLLLSPQTISPACFMTGDSTLSVNQLPFDGDFKVKFGMSNFTIGPVTAFGLVKTAPFSFVDILSINKNLFTCDPKWNICTCKKCTCFSCLIDLEADARKVFPRRKPESVILFGAI